MTTADIIIAIIAGISLIFSIFTFYMTFAQRFKGIVIPERRVILTRVGDDYVLGLECAFINLGANSGSIEDIQILILKTGASSVLFTFGPTLVIKEYNVNATYQKSDFRQFSSVSLGPKGSKTLFVLFKQIETEDSSNVRFTPAEGTYELRMKFSYPNMRDFRNSPVVFSIPITKKVVERWTATDGQQAYIEAVEIGTRRINILRRIAW